MSQDSSFRQAYDAREKVLMDEAAKFAHAETEGMKRGMEKGMERGMERVWKRLRTRYRKRSKRRSSTGKNPND